MAISPDTFLLITVCSGVLIIIVGMIIAINSPLKALSCSFYYQQCGRLFKWGCRKKKEESWKKNIIKYSNDKKLSLVEGRPQGHGFYTAGPWSSTETTTTCIGMDTLHSTGGTYFAMMNGNSSSTGITSTDNSSSATVAAPVFGVGGSSSSLSINYGLHGDNSNALNFGHVCMSCHGAGFINPSTMDMYQVVGSSGIPINYNSAQQQLDGVSSGCLSASSDSMMAAEDDMDCDDADADMIMCM